tara:strand:+ start:3415 stop:3966 length:552 start_codon:yes stop_codon:yes gene_type:complete
MKITKSQLMKIIKEELNEAYGGAKGPFPDRYGLSVAPSPAEEPEMYAADDELRELGDKISDMVVLSRQVEELMLDMGMRHGELAALGTNARTAKKIIKELENIYKQKLDDIARFSTSSISEDEGIGRYYARKEEERKRLSAELVELEAQLKRVPPTHRALKKEINDKIAKTKAALEAARYVGD